MGHKEDLIAGAKRCLYELGYERTTARDIVAASGTNLASIGYHFGSKEALLNAALFEAIEEWSDELARALAADIEPSATPLARFEAIWTRITNSFTARRALWLASVEAMMVAEHSPEVRAFLSGALQEGRQGMAALFQSIELPVDEETTRTVGSFYQALMSGVMVQWLIDPERAPSGRDLAEALRIISKSVQTTGSGSSADKQ